MYKQRGVLLLSQDIYTTSQVSTNLHINYYSFTHFLIIVVNKISLNINGNMNYKHPGASGDAFKKLMKEVSYAGHLLLWQYT